MAVKAGDIEKSVLFYRDFLGFAEQCRLNNLKDGSLMLVCFKVNDEQSIEVFTGLLPGEERRRHETESVACGRSMSRIRR